MDKSLDKKCHEIQHHLVDHVRGTSGRINEMLNRHLSECSECREWMTFIKRVDGALSQQQQGARLGYEKRLLPVLEVAEQRVKPGRLQRRFLLLVIAAATVVVAIFGRLIPLVEETITWIAGLGGNGLLFLLGGAAALLILSCPILIARSMRRMEELS